MTFASPLWLLLFVPLYYWWRKGRAQMLTLKMPQTNRHFSGATWRSKVRPLWNRIGLFSLGLLVLAMARPQKKWQEEKVKADALDIVLAMDISPSMLSKDFDPDRLTVAKKVAVDFVENRPHDRIGLVAFSAEAFTQCPLTADRKVVQSFIRELTVGRLKDGTAIGMGLATAINRMKESPSRSKIVILLTDGENTTGYITPDQATEIAVSLGIRVYTVGIGSEGVVMSPSQRGPNGSYIFGPRMLKFNTDLLKDIADRTKGKFYRAYSERDLKGIYAEIDRLEKTKVEIKTVQRTKEYYEWFVGIAIALLLLEFLGRWTVLRSVTP
ncbi:MAG: VWA domain-containing protein [Saprospiraceae bacterium]|nr:VWA domain-containing protein [Saprospiraceae bacterium]MCB9345841.1 VWA domain-containing protein [Lewinellaceae bacterium]